LWIADNLIICHTLLVVDTHDISVGVAVLLVIPTAHAGLEVVASGHALLHRALPNPFAQGNLKQVECFVYFYCMSYFRNLIFFFCNSWISLKQVEASY
jgi:hypothetical protein